jgi:hypothetical protein
VPIKLPFKVRENDRAEAVAGFVRVSDAAAFALRRSDQVGRAAVLLQGRVLRRFERGDEVLTETAEGSAPA